MTNRISRGKKVLASLLIVAALALLAPVASYLKSITGTNVASTDVSAQTPTKTLATTDSTATTDVGLNSGVTSLAADANGNVYASLEYSSTVVKLNGGGTVIGKFEVGANPTGLVVDDANGVLYVLNNADNTISKLGLDGAPIATFKVAGEGPVHAALYGGSLYIACEDSNTLVMMTTEGVAQGSTPVGARPVWVAVAAGASKTAAADSTLVAADGTVAKTGSTANIYVSCNKANQVWKLSSAGAVLSKYESGRGPYGIAINGSGDILVACFWDAVVQRMNGATGEVLGKTAVGDGASGMITYGNVVAVVENGTNSITRLSLADGSVISKDKVDRSPLAGTATGSALWVACTGTGTIARRAL